MRFMSAAGKEKARGGIKHETGVGLGYTLLSVGTSVLLGLPGVALLLLGNLL